MARVVSSWVRDQCAKAKSRLFKLRARQNVRVTDRHQQVYSSAWWLSSFSFSPPIQKVAVCRRDPEIFSLCLFNGPAGWPPVVSLVPSVLPTYNTSLEVITTGAILILISFFQFRHMKEQKEKEESCLACRAARIEASHPSAASRAIILDIYQKEQARKAFRLPTTLDTF